MVAERASAHHLAGTLPCGAVGGRGTGGRAEGPVLISLVHFQKRRLVSGAGATIRNATMALDIWHRTPCTQGKTCHVFCIHNTLEKREKL